MTIPASDLTQDVIDLSRKFPEEWLLKAKQNGFSDFQLANIFNTTEPSIRALRKHYGVESVFKTVDTCAAEFEATTPYHYSSYEEENESFSSDRKKVIILGGGPNRIGQGIEFDYCCVQAVFALREAGYETIMVNCNPKPSLQTTILQTSSTSSLLLLKTPSVSLNTKSLSVLSSALEVRRL